MSVSLRDLDPAFQGAGQKAYPDFNRLNFYMHHYAVGITLFFYGRSVLFAK